MTTTPEMVEKVAKRICATHSSTAWKDHAEGYRESCRYDAREAIAAHTQALEEAGFVIAKQGHKAPFVINTLKDQ